jgi:hypothetical protein
MKVNAESGEIVLQNTNGDTIIVPRTHREKVLKYIEEGNYKAIDDIAEGLPFMEDYADEGSLIVNELAKDPTPEEPISPVYTYGKYSSNKPFEKDFKVTQELPADWGFGNQEEMQQRSTDWQNSYGLDIRGELVKNPPKFVSATKDSYPRYQQAPNPYSKSGYGIEVAGHHCLGSACRASKQYNPTLPTTYDVLGRQLGIFYASTEGETGDASLDSWEIHQMLEDTGTGTILFKKGLGDKDRQKYIDEFDPSQLPLGSILSYGDAKDKSAGYVDTNAKSYRGKNEPLPRHTATLQKYDEETGDMLIYDYGNIERVANRELTEEEKKQNEISIKKTGKPKIRQWKDYAREENLVYASKINQAGDWTYKTLKDYKTARSEKVPEKLDSKKIDKVEYNKKKVEL